MMRVRGSLQRIATALVLLSACAVEPEPVEHTQPEAADVDADEVIAAPEQVGTTTEHAIAATARVFDVTTSRGVAPPDRVNSGLSVADSLSSLRTDPRSAALVKAQWISSESDERTHRSRWRVVETVWGAHVGEEFLLEQELFEGTLPSCGAVSDGGDKVLLVEYAGAASTLPAVVRPVRDRIGNAVALVEVEGGNLRWSHMGNVSKAELTQATASWARTQH